MNKHDRGAERDHATNATLMYQLMSVLLLLLDCVVVCS